VRHRMGPLPPRARADARRAGDSSASCKNAEAGEHHRARRYSLHRDPVLFSLIASTGLCTSEALRIQRTGLDQDPWKGLPGANHLLRHREAEAAVARIAPPEGHEAIPHRELLFTMQGSVAPLASSRTYRPYGVGRRLTRERSRQLQSPSSRKQQRPPLFALLGRQPFRQKPREPGRACWQRSTRVTPREAALAQQARLHAERVSTQQTGRAP
jgi:hypothetical protein